MLRNVNAECMPMETPISMIIRYITNKNAENDEIVNFMLVVDLR